MRNVPTFLLGAGLLLSASFASAQLPEPILHYSFDKGTSTFVGGEAVTDSSPSGYDGTLSSNTVPTCGTFGNSIYFSPGRRIDVGLPLFSTTDAFQPYTISLWVKTPEESVGGFITQYDSGNSLRWGTDGRSSQGGVPVWWTNGTYNAVGTTPINDDQWHHIVYVKDAAQNLSIYVDGRDDTDRGGTYSNTHPSAFMNVNSTVGTFKSGTLDLTARMDELKVYDQALGAGEIANLYQYNSLEAPENPVLKVDLGGYFPDGAVGSYQYVTPGWRGMTASAAEASGPVTDTFGYADGQVTVTVGSASGLVNWQNRARSAYNCYVNHPIGDVANDFAYVGSSDTLQVTIEGLPAGEHYLRTYHHDTRSDYGAVDVSVSDADGANRSIVVGQPITYGGGNSSAWNDPDPGIIGTVPFKVVSDGTNPVVVSVDANTSFTHLSGFELASTLPADLNVDFQGAAGDTQEGFQAFAHPASAPDDPQQMWFFTELGNEGSVGVTYSRSETEKAYSVRDRGQMTLSPMADLAEDFIATGNDPDDHA